MTALFFILPLLLTSCATPPAEKGARRPVSFSALPGWSQDHQREAIVPLQRSCGASKKPMCLALRDNPPQTDEEARRFFERWFQPYAVEGEGLFTGYYEAELNGAWQRGGRYQTPLWTRPEDLISVDLGAFRPELKGQKIVGKVVGQNLKPYDDRAAVSRGSLQNRAKPLLWVDDPVTSFFLEIQGSGRVRMMDGKIVRVGYAAQNGHTYVAVGRVLADEGQLDRPVTMEKIRGWLKTHPDKAQHLMNRNPSVVFFREIEGEQAGPLGAANVPLTPMRSLAVDPAFVPLGTPVWLVTKQPAMARLVLAQDTGGAIKGPVRGDLFWGAGAKAEAGAGPMQSAGTYFLLLPRGAE